MGRGRNTIARVVLHKGPEPVVKPVGAAGNPWTGDDVAQVMDGIGRQVILSRHVDTAGNNRLAIDHKVLGMVKGNLTQWTIGASTGR